MHLIDRRIARWTHKFMKSKTVCGSSVLDSNTRSSVSVRICRVQLTPAIQHNVTAIAYIHVGCSTRTHTWNECQPRESISFLSSSPQRRNSGGTIQSSSTSARSVVEPRLWTLAISDRAVCQPISRPPATPPASCSACSETVAYRYPKSKKSNRRDKASTHYD